MSRLKRFISGEVQLQITGRHAERFLQLCARNNIEIRDLECTGTNCFCCTMTKNDVWASHPYYRKTGVRCRIQKKKGVPFIFFRYRKRILFPIALCMMVYLFGYCSRFIWRVEITGNMYLTDEYLLSYLEEKDAAPGAKKSTIDCDELVLALREDFDEIIWASAAVEGTVLQITVQEKAATESKANQSDDEHESEKSENYLNEADQSAASIFESTEYTEIDSSDSYVLTASKDAIVESIITRRGLARVKAGDTVLAGDILVEGKQEVPDDNGETKFWYVTEPDADIIGVVTYFYTDTIEETVIEKNFGDASISSFYIQLSNRRFSVDLSVSVDENAEQLENYYQFHITDQFYLPFGVGIIRSIPVTNIEVMLTKEEALDTANFRLQKYLEELKESGTEIIDQNLTMKKESEAYIVEGEITARESIGVLCKLSDAYSAN